MLNNIDAFSGEVKNMANTIEEVNTKQNNKKSVRAGHNQAGYVAGMVCRASALFMADVGELANIDTTQKDALKNVMSACLDAVNEKYKPSVKLDIQDYDFQAGKYSRAESKQPAQAETPATTQAVTPPAQAETPQVAIPSDTQPTIPINDALLVWIKANKTEQKDFDALRVELKAIGNSDEIINAHFDKAFPVNK